MFIMDFEFFNWENEIITVKIIKPYKSKSFENTFASIQNLNTKGEN